MLTGPDMSLTATAQAPAASLGEAEAFREAGNWLAAANVVKANLTRDIGSVDAWANLGLTLSQTAMMPEAELASGRALLLDPSNAVALRALAAVRFKQQREPEAFALSKLALVYAPGCPRVIAMLAAMRIAAQRLSDADVLLRRAAGIEPLAEISANRAMLESVRENRAAAIGHAKAALERKPFLSHIWNLLASLYQSQAAAMARREDWQQARSSLNLALAIQPGNADLLTQIGGTLASVKQYAAAGKAFARAQELAPSFTAALRAHATMFVSMGDKPAAARLLKRAVVLEPDKAKLWLQMATVRSDASARESSANYGHALVLDPQAVQAWQGVAAAAMRREQPAQAEACLRQALGHVSNSTELWAHLGDVLGAALRHAEAGAAYARALALKPDFVEAWQGAASLSLRRENLTAAECQVRRALAIRTQSTDILAQLGDILAAAGRYDEAELANGHALTLEPAVAKLLQAKAALHMQQDGYAQAEHWLSRALAITNNDFEIWGQLATVLDAAERYDDAEQACRHALGLSPDNAKINLNLGALLHKQENINAALSYYRRALALKPDYAEALNTLGCGLRELHDAPASIIVHARALVLKPDYAEGYNNLAASLKEAKRESEALENYEKAAIFKPAYAEAYNNLGALLESTKGLDAASSAYSKALALKPDYDIAYSNLGNAYMNAGFLAKALGSYKKSLALKPDLADAHNNQGNALKLTGGYQAAILAYHRALWCKPDFDDVRFNLAMALLASGNLSEGWAGYEHRYGIVVKRGFHYPVWKGESLAGKAILVWGEQGVGDELLFANIYADVIAQSRRCVIECAPKLATFLARNFPEAEVVATSDPPHPATLGAFDYQSACGSLPRYLRPTLESFPERRGYLSAIPERVSIWRERLARLGQGLKIGISWRSSNMTGQRALSHTRLIDWDSIFAARGVHFVKLQYDDCATELAEVKERHGISIHEFPEVNLRDDIDEAAALISGLDLVICTSSFTGVLAPALGTPTWLLIYGPVLESLGTEYAPWFPGLRPFFKTWEHAWDGMLDLVARELRILVRQSSTDELPGGD